MNNAVSIWAVREERVGPMCVVRAEHVWLVWAGMTFCLSIQVTA